MGPDDFANLAARALEPKLPDIISVAHIHAARVSVREQAAIIVERLRRVGQASFRTLTRDCDTTLLVVARFLALLEIYRDGLVTFDQPTPLGELYVRWIGDDDLDANSLREIDEFDTTEVQDFRTQLGDVEASEQVDDEIGDQPNE
jgi:segregation and condensation protein A